MGWERGGEWWCCLPFNERYKPTMAASQKMLSIWTLGNSNISQIIYLSHFTLFFSLINKCFCVFLFMALFFILLYAPELFLERLLKEHSEYWESGRQPRTADLGVDSISLELDTLMLRLAHWPSLLLHWPMLGPYCICECVSVYMCVRTSECCQLPVAVQFASIRTVSQQAEPTAAPKIIRL